LLSLRARLAKLEAARLPPRQVIVAAGSRELVDWGEVARLEAAGLQVVIVTTGIVRGPLDPVVEHEEAGPCAR
jgi:hypothetical protein